MTASGATPRILSAALRWNSTVGGTTTTTTTTTAAAAGATQSKVKKETVVETVHVVNINVNETVSANHQQQTTTNTSGGQPIPAPTSTTGNISQATTATNSFRPQDLQGAANSQLLFEALAASKLSVLTRSSFDHICQTSGVNPTPDAIARLVAAGVIVDMGEIISIKPSQLLEQAGNVVQDHWDPLFAARQRLDQLESQLPPFEKAISEAVAQAAKSRKAVWGTTLAFSGAQLAIISRLTYFDLDWDIMEPVSYFLGTGTALIFYFWMLYFREEHIYEKFDKRLVSKRVRNILLKEGFDFVAYRKLVADINKTKDVLAQTEKWFSQH
jgi:hypothetical protein